jgi:hypothetical protein
MPRGVSLTLTESAAVGLFFIQRYRFLTIDQFARAADLNRSTAADQLRFFERHGMLGYFGNTGLAGHGKTPACFVRNLTERPIPLTIRFGTMEGQPQLTTEAFHALRAQNRARFSSATDDNALPQGQAPDASPTQQPALTPEKPELL